MGMRDVASSIFFCGSSLRAWLSRHCPLRSGVGFAAGAANADCGANAQAAAIKEATSSARIKFMVALLSGHRWRRVADHVAGDPPGASVQRGELPRGIALPGHSVVADAPFVASLRLPARPPAGA